MATTVGAPGLRTSGQNPLDWRPSRLGPVRNDAVPAASTAEMDGGTVRAAARRWASVTTVARDDSRIAHIAASRSSAAQSAAE